MTTEQEFMNIETGDEIHLTSGEIWSCVPKTCGQVNLGVHFVRCSFAKLQEGHMPWDAETIPNNIIRNLLWDAVQGGATIVKGVGLATQTIQAR